MQLRRSASLKRGGGRVTPESSVNEVGINYTRQNQLLLEIPGGRGYLGVFFIFLFSFQLAAAAKLREREREEMITGGLTC